MNKRPFGIDLVSISEVGLGCWQLGSDWGDVSEAQAVSILESALEQGITFFDTADVYGGGRSEKLIGKFLREREDEVFVATKAGRTEQLYPNQYNPDTLKAAICNSLKNLQIDTLDLVQMHCIPFEVMKQGDVWGHLEDLKKAGLIKRFGASVETMEEAVWCVDNIENLYSLQIIFNPFRQKPIKKLFDKALSKNIGIIARVPLASGLLSGKFSKETTFSPTDHRNYNADGNAFNVGETFAGIPLSKGIELVSELDSIRNDNSPLAQWSLRWILDHPAISTVIPGASSPKQVISNTAASSMKPLELETHQRVRALYKTKVKQHIRGAY